MKKNTYTAYTRVINQKTHYFVKKFDTFEGLRNIPPILNSMGMHRDFLKACELANIQDEHVIHSLMDELNLTTVSGRVIPITHVKRVARQGRVASIWYPQYWLSKLGLAHI